MTEDQGGAYIDSISTMERDCRSGFESKTWE